MCLCSLNKSIMFIILMVYLFLQVSCELPFKYHTNQEIETILKRFEITGKKKLHTHLYSIGNSSNEKNPFPLWVLQLTAADSKQTGIPNIKLLGNMHGNEAGGREILLHFIEFLIDQYLKNDTVTWLLQNTKIHIIPTINPDGFTIASNACNGVMGRKVPTKNVDMNRNFPDYFMPDPDIQHAKETLAVMQWMNSTKFILSAALHEGAMVANYPYDFNPECETTEFLTPDTDVFRFLAKTYADNHPEMKNIKCPKANKFDDGITSGAAWYPFSGGMGDYNYNFQGCMEVTLELSCCKYPPANTLPKLWEDNKQSLLLYCMQANRGVTGRILDGSTKKPVEAKLQIIGRHEISLPDRIVELSFRSFNKTGEFWRLLLPGKYTLKVEADGYYTNFTNFVVEETKTFPKLTNITIILINSSIPTTTSTTTTTTKSTTITVPTISSRFSDEVGTTLQDDVRIEELKSGFAISNNNNFIIVIYLIIFLLLLR